MHWLMDRINLLRYHKGNHQIYKTTKHDKEIMDAKRRMHSFGNVIACD